LKKEDVSIVSGIWNPESKYSIAIKLDGRSYLLQEEYALNDVVGVRDDLITYEKLK